jgi:hypothetical protein
MRRLALLLCSLAFSLAALADEVRATEINLLCQSVSNPKSVRKVFVDTTARYVKYGGEKYRNGKKHRLSPDGTPSTEFVNIDEDTITFGYNYTLEDKPQTNTYSIDRKTGTVTEHGSAGRVRCSPAPERRKHSGWLWRRSSNP